MLYYIAIRAAIYHNPTYEIYLYTDDELDYVNNIFFKNLKDKIIVNIVSEPKSLNGNIIRRFQHKADYIRLYAL